MERALEGTKRHWAVAAVGAAVIAALLLPLFRLPRNPSIVAHPVPKPTVELRSGGNTAFSDEAMLRDPTPLFLPTEKNAAQKKMPEIELGRTFLDKETPNWAFADSELKLNILFGVEGKGAENPVSLDVLAADAPGPLLMGFGRSDPPAEALSPRGGRVEVFAANGGRRVWSEELGVAARPASAATWQPLEILATVDEAGLAGPLVVTARSGVDEVDAYFQNYLARTLKIGERLAPGFYRISVGP